MAYAWFVVTVLSAAYFVSIVDRFFMAVAMVPIKADLGLTDTQLGVLQGLGFAVLFIFATPLFGRLADTANRRNLILFGIFGWTVATIACGFAGSFESLLGARVGLGLAEAALLPAGMSLIMAYFDRGKVGRATSVFVMGGNLGGLAALVGGGMLLEYFAGTGGLKLGQLHFAPWQSLFVVGALPGVVVMILMLSVREPARSWGPRSKASSGGLMVALREIRSNVTAYVSHVIAVTCALVLGGGLVAWSTAFYVRSHHLTVGNAAIAAGLCGGIAGISGLAAGGVVLDRLRRRRLGGEPGLIITTCLALSFPATMLFTFSESLGLSLTGFALASFLLQATQPAGHAGIQLMASDRSRGTITGLFVAIVTIGSFGLGPVCIGFLNDRVFTSPEGLGSSIAALNAALALVGLVFATRSRRPYTLATSGSTC